MKKFLITRIGLNMKKVGEEDKLFSKTVENYIEGAVKTLCEFTVNSVRDQTILKEIEWIFIYGSLLKNVHIEKIKEATKGIKVRFSGCENNYDPKSVSIYSGKKLSDYLEKISGSKEFITMRLDADDYMNPCLLEKIVEGLLSKYNGNNTVVCVPKYGYVMYKDSEIYPFTREGLGIGSGVVSNCGDHCQHKHHSIADIIKKEGKKVDYVVLENKDMYIYNRCDISHQLDVRDYSIGKEKIKDITEIEKIFKIKLKVQNESIGSGPGL